MNTNTKKLLLIDDEKELCENLSEFLSDIGYDVTIATRGKEALSILDNTSFPVILTDINMPDINGKDILKFVLERHPSTKVIMVTGHTEEYGRDEFISLGACDYITKPIHFAELLKTLKKLY